jgi:Uma2 family endonuclease
MAAQPTTGLTYADLGAFPDDNLRRELIDGELFVTPSPIPRHQRVVVKLAAALLAYEERGGGEVYPAPMDVFFADTNVVEPDVLFVRTEHLPPAEAKNIASVPVSVFHAGDLLESSALPGFAFELSAILTPPSEA